MNQKRSGQTIVLSIAIACMTILVAGALYYAHRNHSNGGTGSNPNSLAAQTPTITHNTSPTTSPCPNDAPPMALNIGGNAVEACSQPIDGTVSAITTTSITVQIAGSGSQTFSIVGGTQITHHGQSLTATEIKIGDTVSLIPNNSNANEAWYILVNPSIQG